MDNLEVMRRGVAVVRTILADVPDAAWSAPSPCDGWTVRDVANHLANECAWVPDMMAGRTIADVGEAHDGDLLGDDPVASFERLSDAALAAFAEDPQGERTVHLSFGDVPAAVYIAQLGFDHVVHGWDIATGAGIEAPIDDDLARAAHESIAPMLTPEVRSAVFADEQPPPPNATAIEALAAFTGRRV